METLIALTDLLFLQRCWTPRALFSLHLVIKKEVSAVSDLYGESKVRVR